MSFRFLGITIDRKTDVLAFAAFVISIGSLLAQFVNLVRGPEIVLIGPKLVTIYSATASDDKDYLRMVAGFTYLNKGSPGYDDILKSEAAFVVMNGITVKLTARNYIETSSSNKNMNRTYMDDALPVALKSGEVIIHETEFIPFPGQNTEKAAEYTELSEFIKKLENTSSLVIKFVIQTYEGQTINKDCVLKPEKVLHYLKDESKTINSKKRAWSTSVCSYQSE